jgi:phage-related protein
MVHLYQMNPEYPLPVRFFKTETGNEPVREWLRSLSDREKRLIGIDIKTVQFGWPLGMPLIRSLCPGIWEVRTKLDNRISRVLFTVFENQIILLHGFIKKTQKTPKDDFNLAIRRMKQVRRAGCT